MNAIDVLKGARALIANEKDWGDRNNPGRGNGCAIVVIFRAGRLAGVKADSVDSNVHCATINAACRALEKAVGFDSIPWWNDSHTHEQVLAGFDKAIALLEPKRERKTDITPFLDILKSAKSVETV